MPELLEDKAQSRCLEVTPAFFISVPGMTETASSAVTVSRTLPNALQEQLNNKPDDWV